MRGGAGKGRAAHKRNSRHVGRPGREGAGRARPPSGPTPPHKSSGWQRTLSLGLLRRVDGIRSALSDDVKLEVHGDTRGLDGDAALLLISAGVRETGITGLVGRDNTGLWGDDAQRNSERKS